VLTKIEGENHDSPVATGSCHGYFEIQELDLTSDGDDNAFFGCRLEVAVSFLGVAAWDRK
jgi:hypothetical protein